MASHSPFTPLLLITLLAVLIPVLASHIRFARLPIPIVVGEILAGILIGKSGLDLVTPSPTLTFLAEFGFTFLMFLSGLEINFGTLFAAAEAGQEQRRPRWQHPLALAGFCFLGTVLLALVVGLGMERLGLTSNPVLLGLILSTTSLGIVVPVLKEHRLTTTLYGQILLATALLSDFVTLLLLSLVIAALSHGLSLDLLLFLFLLAAFVTAARGAQWASRLPVLVRLVEELSHATAQIQVRGSMALMVAWVVLADALGVEIILGAFLAGAIVSLSSQGHASPLPEKLDAIGYGFFVPLFFIMVGANFDLRALLSSPLALLLVPLLIVAAYLVKVVPSLLFRTLFPWRETLGAGILLSSRLSLVIAASSIALQLDVITAATNAAIILVAVVTCTFSPICFSHLLPQPAEATRQGVIILGTGQLAELLGGRLRQHGEKVTFIGTDVQRLHHLQRAGFQGVAGHPADVSVLQQAGATQAQALIILADAPENVLPVCRLAQEQFAIPTVIVRADEALLIKQLQHLDIRVVQPAMATALALEAVLRFPEAFNMLLDRTEDIDVMDVPLRNRVLTGRRLRHIRLPGNALVLGMRRQGDIIVPHGDTVLQSGDTLMLVGSPESLRQGRQWLEGNQGLPLDTCR